ncbi:hypothetical protein D9M68_831080 [compost metagenome]
MFFSRTRLPSTDVIQPAISRAAAGFGAFSSTTTPNCAVTTGSRSTCSTGMPSRAHCLGKESTSAATYERSPDCRKDSRGALVSMMSALARRSRANFIVFSSPHTRAKAPTMRGSRNWWATILPLYLGSSSCSQDFGTSSGFTRSLL